MTIVASKPRPERTMPTIASVRCDDFRPSTLKTMPTIASGPPQTGRSQEHRLIMPKTRPAIEQGLSHRLWEQMVEGAGGIEVLRT